MLFIIYFAKTNILPNTTGSTLSVPLTYTILQFSQPIFVILLWFNYGNRLTPSPPCNRNFRLKINPELREGGGGR